MKREYIRQQLAGLADRQREREARRLQRKRRYPDGRLPGSKGHPRMNHMPDPRLAA